MGFSASEIEVFQSAKRASSPHTEDPALERLRTHQSEGVRAALLGNSAFAHRASAHARYLLADPRASWVTFQAIASSVHIDTDLYDRVYDEKKWYVLIALATNPVCPRELLMRIAESEDPNNADVAKVARARLGLPRPS